MTTRCRVLIVDGDPVIVRMAGDTDPADDDLEAWCDLVRAMRARLEHDEAAST